MPALASQAQIKIIPREKLEETASPRLSSDSSSLSFNARYVKAEPMREDDPPQVLRYEMTNAGSGRVEVLRMQTTCSCVSASIGQKALDPGEKTVLTVRYDPKGHLGRFEHKVFVYTRPGNEPAATLGFSVEVGSGSDISRLYQIKMGCIALRSREVSFNRDAGGVEVLKFVNLSGKPLKLECEEMFLPRCITFKTSPQVLEDGCEGEIIIAYDPSKGQAKERVPLILRNLGVQPSGSTINIRIE